MAKHARNIEIIFWHRLAAVAFPRWRSSEFNPSLLSGCEKRLCRPHALASLAALGDKVTPSLRHFRRGVAFQWLTVFWRLRLTGWLSAKLHQIYDVSKPWSRGIL
ncbi:MAG: hypothetical protein DLM68_18750 [Hyphomicrobiales bacterium]|nr:MAG: hypothetical protein DLM68_18750 [Hyphomicrobiales bacterium]